MYLLAGHNLPQRGALLAGHALAGDIGLPVTPPDASAVVSALTISGAQAGGNLPVSITIDKASPIAWGMGSGSKPTAADLRAGTGMTDFGNISAVASGPLSAPFGDGLDVTGQNLWVVPEGSNVVTQATGSVPFDIDTTDPTGTISAAQTGATTAAVSLDLTDEPGDLIDFAIYPVADTPTAANVASGTGAAWSLQDVVGTAGDTNDQSATGLTASTSYRAWAVITDAQGQSVTLTSTAFTTDAAAPSVDYLEDFQGVSFSRVIGSYDIFDYGETEESYTWTHEPSRTLLSGLTGGTVGALTNVVSGNEWRRVLVPVDVFASGGTITVRSGFNTGSSTARTGRMLMLWLDALGSNLGEPFPVDTGDVSGNFSVVMQNATIAIPAAPTGATHLGILHRVTGGTLVIHDLEIEGA